MTPPAQVSTAPRSACVEPVDVRGCAHEVMVREGMTWAIPAWDCIISHESGWNQRELHLDTNGYYSRGLAQINDQWHAWRWGGRRWDSPEDNIEVAIEVYDAAGGWWPWSTAKGCGLR